MTSCDHRWIPVEGQRARYYCELCPATGHRSLGQYGTAVKPHKKPHPELRPSETTPAEPTGPATGPHYVTTGRIPPKPRPA